MSAPDYPFVIEDLKGLPETLGYVTTIFDTHAETRLDLDGRHANRNGRLHGGVLATLLDAALGFAASDAFRKAEDGDTWDVPVLTLAMNVNFVAATDSDAIVATGRVDRAGRAIAFASGRVEDGRGELLATGTATFKRTRLRGNR